MICKKCGAPMPDSAKFCGKCGAVAEKTHVSPAAMIRADKEIKKYKRISVVLAILCIIMGLGWAITAHDPYRNAENYEVEASQVERAGIQMSGTYVVGEDEELPQGRYNIYPPEGESYFDVAIYATREDAKKKYDEEYHSLAEDQLYRLTQGYKLKAGQIVVIDPGSAYFELVTDNAAGEESASDAETTAPEETE